LKIDIVRNSLSVFISSAACGEFNRTIKKQKIGECLVVISRSNPVDDGFVRRLARRNFSEGGNIQKANHKSPRDETTLLNISCGE